MPGTGRSQIGQVQQASTATAENLDMTAQNMHAMEPALRKIWTHMQEAMGDSHQDDVPEMGEIVELAAKALVDGADTLAECAKSVREIEARL